MEVGVDLTGGQGCSVRNCPLTRLCRRRRDGHSLLSYLIPEHLEKTTWETYKNNMLEEAVKSGSHTTVKVGNFRQFRALLNSTHVLYFCQLLLENGADPNVRGTFLIHKAADAHYQNIAKVEYFLLHSDSDVNQEDQTGQTLLHRAAGGRPPRPELLKLALGHERIDPNKQDRKGDTALHKVTSNYAGREMEWKQCTEVMRHLLCHKRINPNIRNKQGQTSLQNLVILSLHVSAQP